jgi:PAS domain S-box-containing protein
MIPYTKEALEESRRILQHAERISHIAHWDRNLKTDELAWSDEFFRIFGLVSQKRKTPLSQVVEIIHPADRANVLKAISTFREDGSNHATYRIIRPDGQIRYIEGNGKVIRDDAGRPCRTVGFIQDVTEYHQARAALEEANRLLEAKNTALREVLASIEAEREKIGQRIDENVQEIILPLLESLRKGATRQQQRAIDEIERSLREITSPFVDTVARAVKNLTPSEMRICSFTKRGLSVKQIADLEHLSPETIAAHRRNIRRKLQIANRKVNLTTYLRDTFSEHPATAP